MRLFYLMETGASKPDAVWSRGVITEHPLTDIGELMTNQDCKIALILIRQNVSTQRGIRELIFFIVTDSCFGQKKIRENVFASVIPSLDAVTEFVRPDDIVCGRASEEMEKFLKELAMEGIETHCIKDGEEIHEIFGVSGKVRKAGS